MALSKTELYALVLNKLVSGSKIPATNHRDVENAIIDALLDVDAIQDILKAYSYNASYFWNTTTERDAEIGMSNGERGLVIDEGKIYEYVAPPGNWELYGELDILPDLTNSSLWEDDYSFVTLSTPRQIQLSKMLQTGQSISIPSANILTLPANGNYVNISDIANDIQLISNLDSDGKAIQGGTEYIIDCPEGLVFEHLFTPSGNGKKIRLDCKQKFTSPGNWYKIVYDSIDEQWEMGGTSTGDVVKDLNNIIAKPQNANGYEINSTATITYSKFYINQAISISNMGSANVSIIDGEIIVGAGTIYGIIGFDNLGNKLFELPCDEGNTSVPILHDCENGLIFGIDTLDDVIEQDTYFKSEENGYENITIVDDSEVINVPKLNNGNSIYNS